VARTSSLAPLPATVLMTMLDSNAFHIDDSESETKSNAYDPIYPSLVN
jgi:hypothetical protein